MNIRIEFDAEREPCGSILADTDFPQNYWNRICRAVLSVQADAEILHRAIHLEWVALLSVAEEVAVLQHTYGFDISYNDQAWHALDRFGDEVEVVRRLALRGGPDSGVGDIDSRLMDCGFSRRRLTNEQRRDAASLIAIGNGANFSVPGAGKTTVAVAVHLLTRTPETHLLIVAPKNAFSAWDEAIEDCMHQSVVDHLRIVRLVGGSDSIEQALLSAPRNMIISYEQLSRVREQVGLFLRSHPTHLVLDESHRIKAGVRSQRGDALLRLSHLPIRRDILSGTPITNSKEDIRPQLDFLWPGQRLGWRAISSSNLNQVIRSLYVRTTKAELGLPPISRQPIGVDMSPSQLALYGMVRREILSRRAMIENRTRLRKARMSVMRLLQVSSNPILAVQNMLSLSGDSTHLKDPALEAIAQDIIREIDSPKVLKACEMARHLAAEGLRTVIWTSFTRNVERIAELLSDLGAVFIHGGVDSGDSADCSTREGRIRMFHDGENGCQVLVANPAACAEGISLHKVCHHAIYVDRTYNAAHYIQSEDRIHRLGLPRDVETKIYILESIAPAVVGSIDYSVRRRLESKFDIMCEALDDQELNQLKLDEEEDVPLDSSITVEDMIDLIDELSGRSTVADPTSRT